MAQPEAHGDTEQRGDTAQPVDTTPPGLPQERSDGVPPRNDAQPDAEPPVRRRPLPVPPPLNLGRRLRALAGVDEKLLAYVPQERAWYTSLGGVVLGTATIAAFSMWFAINQALGVTSGWAIIPVIVWFFFILSVDRWLVSSRIGGGLRKRLPVLVMRIGMAILFGIIIAEPLVLRVFQTAVEKHIQDERAAQLAELAGRLQRCNPAPKTADAPPPAGCATTDVLSFEQSPSATLKQLTALRADATQLQATLDADAKKLADLNELARRECNGTSGPGLTGRIGEGPNCRRLRREADQYAAAHQIAPNAARLADLRKQITALEGTAQQSQAEFEKARDAQIVDRVAEARSHQGPIGILERLAALHALAAANATLALGIWAVRLFFILVDCMPIVVKYVGGATTYDRLVDQRLRYAEATLEHDLAHEMDERAAVFRKRRAEIDLEVLEHKAELNSRLTAAADRLDSTRY